MVTAFELAISPHRMEYVNYHIITHTKNNNNKAYKVKNSSALTCEGIFLFGLLKDYSIV